MIRAVALLVLLSTPAGPLEPPATPDISVSQEQWSNTQGAAVALARPWYCSVFPNMVSCRK